MDRRERVYNPDEMLQMAIHAMLTGCYSALPGVITRVSSDNMNQTVDVQPAYKLTQRNPDGSFGTKKMPVLLDCPIAWQGGGGMTLTFPIKAGDECLVIFASRCIDPWWAQGVDAQGNVPDTPDIRLHDLSDGFAMVGVRSKPHGFAASSSKVRLQTDNASCYFEIDPSAGSMNIHMPGGVTINGATVDASGHVTDGAGTVLHTHVHSGVQTGSSNTGAPV